MTKATGALSARRHTRPRSLRTLSYRGGALRLNDNDEAPVARLIPRILLNTQVSARHLFGERLVRLAIHTYPLTSDEVTAWQTPLCRGNRELPLGWFFRTVIGGLVAEIGVVELRIMSAGRHQLIVASLFNDLTLAHHDDPVGMADCDQAVGDHDR